MYFYIVRCKYYLTKINKNTQKEKKNVRELFFFAFCLNDCSRRCLRI